MQETQQIKETHATEHYYIIIVECTLLVFKDRSRVLIWCFGGFVEEMPNLKLVSIMGRNTSEII